MNTFSIVMTQTYNVVMTMMQAVTRKNFQGTSENTILNDIHNVHLVDQKKKTAFFEQP